MKLGSIKENIEIEKRVAITPEIAKKFIDNGFEINLEKNYANHLGFKDKDYEALNVNILENKELVLKKSEIISQLNLPSKSALEIIDQNKTLIGILNPYQNSEEINNLVKKINCFSLELLPRITRAQSMDVLSSQANLAGYKAVMDTFGNFEKAIPMMMTAAGTIPAAKVLVIGAGVAGLQR